MSASNAPPPLSHDHPSLPPPPPPVAGDEDLRIVGLVDRTIVGDVAAWHQLWEGIIPVIDGVTACSRWTSRLHRSRDDRDDIVVRVMGQLAAADFEALRRFRAREEEHPEGSFRKWIATVAVHASVSHVRSHPEHLGRGASNDGACWAKVDALSDGDYEAEEIAGAACDPIPAIDAHQLAERLGPRLGPGQRAALGFWLEDMDLGDIAGELGLADGAAAERQVKSALKRVRALLSAEARTARRGAARKIDREE